MIALSISLAIHLAAALALMIVTQPEFKSKLSGFFGGTDKEAIETAEMP